jgi:hypothetical protein
MTAAEKALIETGVRWDGWWVTVAGCKCAACVLSRAVRRVVKERKGK